MIKRTVVGFLCVALALLLGAGGEWYLRGSARALTAALTPQTEDADGVIDAAETAVRTWEQRRLLMGVILKHSDADALAKQFSQLARYAADRDAERCASQLALCETEVRVLLEGERFSWENILHITGKKFLKKLYF